MELGEFVTELDEWSHEVDDAESMLRPDTSSPADWSVDNEEDREDRLGAGASQDLPASTSLVPLCVRSTSCSDDDALSVTSVSTPSDTAPLYWQIPSA